MPPRRLTPARFLAKLRALCLSLPETHEAPSWGHPNFKAGKKIFAAFEHYRERPCIAVKATKADQSVLLGDERFFLPPYVGKHGWVGLWVDVPLPWAMVEELVRDSYRLVANQRMLRKLAD